MSQGSEASNGQEPGSAPNQRAHNHQDDLSFMASWGSYATRTGAGQSVSGFEGPEKRLEIFIDAPTGGEELNEGGSSATLFDVSDEEWRKVLVAVNANIVHAMRDECSVCHAYLLSESSMFVYAHRLILITCGTTTLLNTIPEILAVFHNHGQTIARVSFLRKNFTFPWDQKPPHTSIGLEFALLKGHFPEGRPFILGPADGDHYFLFAVWDQTRRCPRLHQYCHDITVPGTGVPRSYPSNDSRILHVTAVMYDLNEAFTSQHFYTGDGTQHSRDDVTAILRGKSGLESTLGLGDGTPWAVHDLLFYPCGYSLNAVETTSGELQTLHVTPEPEFSYASYETNSGFSAQYLARIRAIIGLFEPKRFTVIIMAAASGADTMGRSARSGGDEFVNFEDYGLETATENVSVASGTDCLVMNWRRYGSR